MKLKNKQTGEIIDKWPDDFVVNSGSQIYNYNSLADLCEEWEDYEEPKDYWVIDIRDGAGYKPYLEEPSEMDFEIGNYFSSKEEAELAVRKLKAWKRLKDKGFKFLDLGGKAIDFEYPDDCRNDHSFWKDLDLLLFGGKE